MGIRLRQLREARGLTVAQMVGRLGVKDSRYRKWESESAAMLEVVARSYAERPFDAGWDWAVWD